MFLDKQHEISDIEDVSSLHIKRFVQYQLEIGNKSNYINTIIKSMRAFYGYLVSEEYVSHNVLAKINLLKEDKVVIKTFTDKEVSKMIEIYDFKSYLNARNNVARAYVDGWNTTYYGLVPDEYLERLSYEEAEQRWLKFLNHENEPFIYIAINDAGKVIGFASGKRIDDENFYGELYSLYLLQECRGLGTGRQLVSAIAKHFKEKGIASMMVWVMEQNKSGLGFYECMGGKEYLRRKSEFGGTVVDDVAYGWKDVSVLCMEEE